jgi:hypothetical protein
MFSGEGAVVAARLCITISVMASYVTLHFTSSRYATQPRESRERAVREPSESRERAVREP